jgi:hypothetical protein
VKPILYIGCPLPERAHTEKTLATAGLSVVWADSGGQALNELQRADMPVLIDLSRARPRCSWPVSSARNGPASCCLPWWTTSGPT